ncbi:MAG: tetratricopeptide repeat protein [Cyanobacteria bacterium P01_E01_bin.6]
MTKNIFKQYWWFFLIGVLVLSGVTARLLTFVINSTSRSDEDIVASIYIPDRHMVSDLYFVTLEGIELEYEQTKNASLEVQPVLKDTLAQGFNLATAGEYDAALERFKEIEGRLRLPSERNNLGVLYVITGDYEKAQEAYQSVFELDPNYEGTYFNIGLLLESQRRLEEAVRYFERSTLEASRERLNTIQAELQKTSHDRELEPNENAGQATSIALTVGVNGVIEDEDDQDFYVFETPETSRDIVHIQFENNTPQMDVTLRFLNANKNYFGSIQTEIDGQNLDYSFSGLPGEAYYVQVFTNALFLSQIGNYTLTVTPTQGYDQYESNETIFSSSLIPINERIDAGILDEDDQDFYYFQAPEDVENVRIRVENRSTTLWPMLTLYDEGKNLIAELRAANAEADIETVFPAESNSEYFIHISGSNSRMAGEYALTITTEE